MVRVIDGLLLCRSPANMAAFADGGLLDIISGLINANPNNVYDIYNAH